MGGAEQAAVEQGTALFGFLTSDVLNLVLRIVGAFVAVGVMIMLAKIISSSVKSRILAGQTGEGADHAEKVAKLVEQIVYIVMLIFAVFIGFEIVGVQIGLILWGISFGVGLAFREVLGNMLAGIMILYTKELKLGDIVEIQGAEKFFGRIEEITVRYTVLRTLDLRQVILPNISLISAPIKTFSAEEIVKLTTTVRVEYGTDLDLATRVVTEAINELRFVVRKENTKVFVNKFADSSVELFAIFFFDPKAGLLQEYAVGYANEAIRNGLKSAGIKIPFPIVTVEFSEGEEKSEKTEKSREKIAAGAAAGFSVGKNLTENPAENSGGAGAGESAGSQQAAGSLMG